MIESMNYIKREDFNKWYEAFKVSGGRLLSNPTGDAEIFVNYTFDDVDLLNKFEYRFHVLTTEVVETRRGFLKRLKTKLGL